MASNVNYEELARYAAEGVARALSSRGGGGGGQGQGKEQAFQLNKIICGGPFIHELYQVTFTQQGGTVQVGEISKAGQLQQ